MHPPDPLPAPALEALEKLQALCPMRLRHYQIGEIPLRIWTACDINPLLNSLVEKNETHPDVVDERMPYWAELWPSSLLMAEAIAENRGRLPRGKWLELGCGPALSGIMAAKTGQAGICSDYMREALWLGSLNAHQNHCEDLISFRHLDWRQPPEDLRVSWILAADLVYENRNFGPLISTFDRLLLPEGEIWLGEPGRRVAEPFFRAMAEEGWRGRVIREQGELTLHGFNR